jgi:choline dehydrogenase-like flavoprotein
VSSPIQAHEASAAEATEELFDAVVIGTGFGGAVTACRLAQAGKNVCILERGRRYGRGDFPRPAERADHLPDTARWAWGLDHGLFDAKDLQGALAVQAAGYGGGSLVYANVHLRPPPEVFSPPTRHGPEANGWPACYSRQELDPYYDVVAANLRVRPIPSTPSPSSGLNGPLPKVEAMRSAAKALRREPWFFLPPLAIDFDKCVMCGECIVGCQIHAKNTLDLNYLAVAERTGVDVDVRTLAEAIDICEDGAGRYTVRYRDHATGNEDAKVRAKSVFLCAGSVNSTYLLLRSKEHLPMPAVSKAQIGRRFFANGDAIAMVYDTADTALAPTPTLGPTITTALLYNQGMPGPTAARGDWFLLEDGGYPKWLEPVLGLFRGDFWLERNRLEPARKDPALRDPKSTQPESEARAKQAHKLARALFGHLNARRAFRRPRGQHPPAEGLNLDQILPPQIREQLIPHLRRFAHLFEARETDPVGRQTMNEVSRRVLAAAKPAWLRPLFKWLAKRAKALVQPQLLPSTLEILHRYFLKAPPNTAEPFTVAVLWPRVVEAARKLFLGRRPDDHAFLMLVMGVDVAPGRLYLDDEQRLLAYWNIAANEPFSMMEERLMHDIADELGGEMRLNPDSTIRQRPVIVHNLGGCAMSDRPEDGVTDANGKVWGTRALYVLDGAAVPGPLGANPSATIATLAERNVRKALEDPSSPIHEPKAVPLDPPLPGGPRLEEIRQRLGQTVDMLDPLAKIPGPAAEPCAPAVGLTFEEVMDGFYTKAGQENLPIRAELVATIEDLNAFLVDPRRPATISGTVWITPARNQEKVAYEAKGTLDLLKRVRPVAALREHFEEALGLLDTLGHVRAQAPITPEVKQARKDAEVAVESLFKRLEQQVHRYQMDYDLDLTPKDGRGELYQFKGVKKIYGAQGLDAWTETTTLKTTLYRANAEVGCGEMHVHLADFLARQLPSFRITGTSDDVQIAWAFGRFFRFFLGTLRQVYLPRIPMLDRFGVKGR